MILAGPDLPRPPWAISVEPFPHTEATAQRERPFSSSGVGVWCHVGLEVSERNTALNNEMLPRSVSMPTFTVEWDSVHILFIHLFTVHSSLYVFPPRTFAKRVDQNPCFPCFSTMASYNML